MRIAIVGWGSLVWNPGRLPHDGRWRRGGPVLPVEFSRISPDGRLTLAIDPERGSEVVTRWTLSPRPDVDTAVADLAARERCETDGIGFLERAGGRSSLDAFPSQRDVRDVLRAWCEGSTIDAVLWTALPATFESRSDTPFSPASAMDYLDSLTGELREVALRYVRNAPAEVDTPVRRAFESDSRFGGGGGLVRIRAEEAGDENGIRAVHEESFPTATEAGLVDALRASGRLRVSLVAELRREIVGHVAFSPVTVAAATDGVGLGPVAVSAPFRRRGIAADLVRAGVETCERDRSGFVVVLGDPGYYRRFGFVPARERGLCDEYGGGDAFQVLELRPGSLPASGGLVRYAPEFAAS